MNGRKMAFSIGLYKILKVFGGYIATYKGGLAMHISSKKAILIPYRDLSNERKRFSIMKDFRLNKVNVTMESGPEYLLPSASIESIFYILFIALGGDRKKIENSIWLTNGDTLRITMNISVRFNLYILLRRLARIVKGELQKIWRKNIKKSII